jgi:uncharacterized protein
MTIATGIELDLERLAEICRRYQVKSLRLFGSAARGEMRPDSDLDFLVEFLPGSQLDLFDFGHLEEELSALTGRRVDLVSRRGLNIHMAPHVMRDAREVYAA